MDREIIGANVRRMRLRRKRSLAWAAEHTGCSRSMISRIELGQQPITTDILSEFAELYACDVKAFLARRRRLAA